MSIFFEKNIKYIYFGIAVLVCLNIFTWKEVFYLYGAKNLSVNFLDIGQGDSAFIVTPQNHQIVVDGGPGSTALEKVAKQLPFWDKSLDLVILTHPEKDHMQGLIEILKRYKANYILWSGVKKSDPEYVEWLKILVSQKNKGAKIITAQKGQEIKAGKVLLDILYPFENLFGKEIGKTANDTSVVAKLIYGKNSFLFTGDISSEAEKSLISVGIESRSELKSDVLKVPHHGSKYSSSSEFLAEVSPKISVISAGKNNSYGHPTPETLQRLENVGSKILRTDLLGDVVIKSDGQNIYLAK